MPEFEPVRFGKYQLIEKIAIGGMAEVYKAKSYGVAGFEKLLVIKKILPHLSRNPEFVAMFINEAKIAVSMNHANIVQVYDLGKVSADYYMAMEFIHGQDLMKVIKFGRKTRRYLPIPTGVYIITEVARGLDYAHSLCDPGGRPLNVVHQDISPHNILISYEGDVKVVDFGIARFGEVEEEEAGKMAGGKFAYMAPEQATAGVVDHRSDIFALGIVLYELATGQRLYAGKDRHEKMRMVRNAEIPPPRAVNPEIPLRLEEILLRALHREPDKRYQRARDMQEDLLSFLYDVGMRVTRADLAHFVKEMFAEEYARSSVGSVVNAIVKDLSELADHPGRELPELELEQEAPEPKSVAATGEWDGLELSLSLDTAGAEAANPAARGERKQVEVLAIEVNGITDAAERLGEEALLRLNFSFLKALNAVVKNYKGVLSRADSDRLLAFWGLEKSTPKDLELCIRCAADLRRLRERFAEAKGENVQLSLGVHRGSVLVAGVGERRSSKLRGYTPWGDTVKLARRLCEAAPLGEVYVSERVFSLLTEWGEFDEGPELPLKWSNTRARPYRLRRLRGRGERGAAGRWIKRGNEFDVLKEVIARAAAGRSTVLAVEGEAGAGKARFLREIREITRDRNIAFYAGKGYFYRREVPFLPFREIIESICGFEDGDSPEKRREKMTRLTELRLDPIDIHIIGELFELEFPNSNLRFLSGDQKRIGTFEAMRKVVAGLSADSFLVLALENFQYFDHYSVDLATYLLRTLPDRKLLLVLTQPRDERLPFPEDTDVIRLQLPSLGQEEVREFAAELLGIPEIPTAVVDQVFEMSSGNALFAKEILSQLRRQGLLVIEGGQARIVGDVASAGIPATVEDLISSRIDSLSSTERVVLEVAATIGRNIDRAVLADVVRLSNDELTEVLARLSALKLIRQAREEDGPDIDFTFRNQLTWEICSRSILTARSKDFHTRVAESLERLRADNLRPHLEELSRHYQAGGLLERAARFSEQAGLAYEKGYFNREAQRCFQRAILLLRGSMGDDGEGRDALVHLADLHNRVGEVLGRAGSWDDAERNHRKALDYAAEAEEGPAECRSLVRLGHAQMETGQHDEAGRTLRRAQALAEQLDDDLLRTDADEEMANFALSRGEFDAARVALNRALQTARARDDRGRVARILGALGAYYLRSGEALLAERTLQKAREMVASTDDKVLQGQLLNHLGVAYIRMERFQEALSCYRESCEIRRSIENRRGVVINLHNIGDVYFRMGDYARAFQYFQESLESAAEQDWEGGRAMNRVHLGYLQSLRGELDEGLQQLENGLAVAQRLGDQETVDQGRVFLARVVTRKGDMERAREILAGGPLRLNHSASA